VVDAPRAAAWMIHLDTDFLIRGLSRGSPEDRRLRSWLTTGEPVGISAVSWAEFLCGPAHAGDVELAIRIVGEPLPFLGDDGPPSARLFTLGGRRRGSLGDGMVAAVAIRTGATLATVNTIDFRRFESAGLRLTAG